MSVELNHTIVRVRDRDEDFDAIHQRLKDAGRQWRADPFKRSPG